MKQNVYGDHNQAIFLRFTARKFPFIQKQVDNIVKNAIKNINKISN